MMFAAVFVLRSFAIADDYLWTPLRTGAVTDAAGALSNEERRAIDVMLARYEIETFHQFYVLTVPTTRSESIDQFSLRVANAWGVGHKNFNNGVLVTWSVRDRKLRIELGLGMRQYVSDETCKTIIEAQMIPLFRAGKHADGLIAGLNRLMDEGRKFVIPEGQRRSVR